MRAGPELVASAVLVSLLTMVSAPAGFAQDQSCLTRADLAGGVRATFVSGRWADYRPEGDTVLRVTESPTKDGHVTSFLSTYGIYDTEMVELQGDQADAGTLVKTSYAADDDLPVPAAEAVWVGQVTIQRPAGDPTIANVIYQFGVAETTKLGDCVYDTLNVKVSFMGGNGWLWQEFTYFTDLGIGAIIARQAQGDEGPSRAKVKSLEPLTN